jgi:hypothetical protein
MVPTPGQPTKPEGMGDVNDHTGATVVLCRRHQRRQESAAWRQALLEKHPAETVYVAWDMATTHEDADVEAVVRGAAGRLVWLSRPTYSPGLNPLAMLWRHVRPDVTPGELFERGKAWLAAAQACVARYHREPHRILSIIGALPKH